MAAGWTSTPGFRLFTTSRIHVDDSGRFTTATPPLALSSLQPFIDQFETLTVYGRVGTTPHGAMPFELNHPRLRVIPIPEYCGVKDFTKRFFTIRSFIHSHIRSNIDYVGVWLPSPISGIVTSRARQIGAPLMTTLVGDGADVAYGMAPQVFKKLSALLTRKQVQWANQRANATVYVTLETLQQLYPPNPDALTLSRTNLSLPTGVFDSPHTWIDVEAESPLRLVAVGSQQQNYKGHDLLLEAVAQLQQGGVECELTLVGSGALHDSLLRQGQELQIKNLTMIPRLGDSAAVIDFVKKQHLFLMPSRTEGMPKALLEAMAAGTLSIGSQVGGIPELLQPPCLFPPESPQAIVETVQRVTQNNETFNHLRSVQRQKAKDVYTHHSGPGILNEFLAHWKGQQETVL